MQSEAAEAGFEIKKSGISGAGLGVYAVRDMEAGSTRLFYWGRLVVYTELEAALVPEAAGGSRLMKTQVVVRGTKPPAYVYVDGSAQCAACYINTTDKDANAEIVEDDELLKTPGKAKAAICIRFFKDIKGRSRTCFFALASMRLNAFLQAARRSSSTMDQHIQ